MGKEEIKKYGYAKSKIASELPQFRKRREKSRFIA